MKGFFSGASGGFNRAPIVHPSIFLGANLVAEYNARLGRTIATGVSQWNDQTSNGYNAANAVGANQPTVTSNNANFNNKDTLNFNGTSQYLQATSFRNLKTDGAFTIFVVGDFITGDTSQTMFEATNGTTANSGIQLLYSTSQMIARVKDTGGTQDAAPYMSITQRGIWEIWYDGTKHRVYKNGNLLKEKSSTTLLNNITQLWIGAIGGAGAGFLLKGDIAHMMFVNKAMTDTERNKMYDYLDYEYRQIPRYDYNIVIDGDSLSTNPDSASSGVQLSYQQQLTTNARMNITNTAVGGMTILSRNTAGSSEASSIVDQHYSPYANKNICIFWMGTNDIHAGASGATVYSRWTTYITDRIAKGWKVIGLTAVERSGAFDTPRSDFNTLARAYSTAGLTVVDMAALSQFDSNGDETNSTYYQVDQVHLTTAGQAITAAQVQSALDTVIAS